MGHDNIVRVRLGNGEGEDLHVRVHHTFEAELKESFSCRLDHEYAFVFPLDAESEYTNTELMDAPTSEEISAAGE